MGSILKTMWKDFIGYEPPKPPINYDSMHAEIVPRSEWGAVEPKSVTEFHELNTPLPLAYVRATGTDECRDRRSCMKMMRTIQERDMYNDMPDLQHNFYVGGDGSIYEGRGWQHMRTPFDEDDLAYNSSISIGAIGPWEVPDKMPPTNMVVAAIYLIKVGMEMGYLRADCLFESMTVRFTV